jgi:hypothetical protein
LHVIFGFGFIGEAFNEAFPESGFSGEPFFIVGWIIVGIVIILLIAFAVKFIIVG